MTSNSETSLSRTCTGRVVGLAAFVASSAYVDCDPSGAVITPPLATRLSAVSPRRIEAASSSAPIATAAATRTGV